MVVVREKNAKPAKFEKKKNWYLSTNDNKQINNSTKIQDMMKLFYFILF